MRVRVFPASLPPIVGRGGRGAGRDGTGIRRLASEELGGVRKVITRLVIAVADHVWAVRRIVLYVIHELLSDAPAVAVKVVREIANVKYHIDLALPMKAGRSLPYIS